jgi:integrase
MRKLREPRKLKNGMYQGRVTVGESDRSIGQFKSRDEALVAEGKWMEEHGHAAMDPTIRFADYAEIVMDARQGEVTAETLSNDRGRLKNWILPHFGRMRVSDITHTRLKAWFNSLPDVPSRRLIYNTMSVVLDYAVQDGILRVKPKVRGATKITQARKPLYTADQLWSVIDQLPEWAQLPFIVQWGFAGRISEMLGLTWDMVDLKTGVVTISKQLYKGKEVDRAKHGSFGEVVLTEEALEALRAHRKARPSIGATPIFMTPSGARLTDRSAYDLWNAARLKAGLPKVVPHDLRRNDLSNYRVATGFDAIKTMDRARQKDYRSYLAYQQDTTPMDVEAIEKLNAAKKRRTS